MDLINQSKFKNILIILLLVLNLLTISIIWMQTVKKNEMQPAAQNNSKSESFNLMKKVLDLSDLQAEQLEKMQNNRINQLKRYNDSSDVLKMQLAAELFKENPDTLLVNSKAEEIGAMESKVEMLRYKHFNELLAICTPKQKERLKPILIELFGSPPPGNKPVEKEEFNNIRREKNSNNDNTPEIKRNSPQGLQDEKLMLPSIDEKVAKYSQRLNLSDDQIKKLRVLLVITKQKDQELRKKLNPEPDEIEIEKERNRKEEDESILKILNENQKREFNKIIMNRRKQ
jgi:hypothetical protein